MHRFTRSRWVVSGIVAVLAIALGTALAACQASGSGDEASALAQVVQLQDGNAPLDGTPADVIGVGDGYVGLVVTQRGPRIVTSTNGQEWETQRPQGLPRGNPYPDPGFPGGLNAITHQLFTDGDAVYLRMRTGTDYDRLGTVQLFASDAADGTWERVDLPVPEGAGALPIAAARAGDRRYIGGAIFQPEYGRSYLDAGLWISEAGGPWRRVTAPAFEGEGNQSIHTLRVDGRTVLAGGGDSTLVPVEECCFYPDGPAVWRSTDGGRRWTRMTLPGVGGDPDIGQGPIVGFEARDATITADLAGRLRPSITSDDDGATWTVTPEPAPSGGVYPPRPSRVLAHRGRLIATTEPTRFCGDCTQGAVAISEEGGGRWRTVTPRFPCGTGERPSYGFVSRPVVVDGSSVAALGGCGPGLSRFDTTLLATSRDGGNHWRVTRFDAPTGRPLPAIAGRHRVVTLAAAPADPVTGEPPRTTPVRVVVVGG